MKNSLALSLLSLMGVMSLANADIPRPVPRPFPTTIPPILIGPKEIPCSDALKRYFNWASGATTAPEDNRWIGFTSVYNQQRNPVHDGLDDKQNVSGYSAGGLKFKSGKLVGDVNSYFNDRLFCPDNGSGGICVPSAPFNPKATDLTGISISSDGKMTTVLKSWGNKAYVDQLVCLDNGVFYIPSKAGQRYISVITLTKSGFRNPR